MCCRWVKNLNQGTEGVEVDDLLQLSYLQRLARQKVAEMEVCLLTMMLPCSCCHDPGLNMLYTLTILRVATRCSVGAL